jgi:hypothetical protein
MPLSALTNSTISFASCALQLSTIHSLTACWILGVITLESLAEYTHLPLEVVLSEFRLAPSWPKSPEIEPISAYRLFSKASKALEISRHADSSP